MSQYDYLVLRPFTDMHEAWENCKNPETLICMMRESMPVAKTLTQGLNMVIKSSLETIIKDFIPKFFPFMHLSLTKNELYCSTDVLNAMANTLKKHKMELEEKQTSCSDAKQVIELGVVSAYYWLACGLIAPTGRIKSAILTIRQLLYMMRYAHSRFIMKDEQKSNDQIKSDICNLIRSEFPNPFPKPQQ
jgi:hypothetical protein